MAFSLSFDVSHVGGCNGDGVGVGVMSRWISSVKGGSRGGLAHREAVHEGNVNVKLHTVLHLQSTWSAHCLSHTNYSSSCPISFAVLRTAS